MYQRPESSSSTLTVSPAPLPGPEPDRAPAPAPHSAAHLTHRIPHWLVRLELFLRVMLRMYIGLAVCYAPWSHTFWDQNPIFLQFPTLANIAMSGAVRGMVSGLGLLNLWIAFQDAIRQRDG
jgi:hypothetical protein